MWVGTVGSAMKLESTLFDVADGIAHVTLNQPERGNPFDQRFCDELSWIAATCDGDPAVRAILLDAAGPFFSVGLDLKTVLHDRDGLPAWVKHSTGAMNSALSRFARGNAPVIAAVHALCVGGGTALVASADFCLAASSASFYAAYCGVGLSCDVGGTTWLPRRLGVRGAAEFLMRNQKWSADEACRRGLVSEVVDDADLSAAARALALELAQGPTLAYGEIKNLLLSVHELPIEAQLEQESRAMARIVTTEDAWTGITEVANRRKPIFDGR
jgi:2-(1,2-epoxy-1,2-dihydrophenyl)acetyl-CoA isomerase